MLGLTFSACSRLLLDLTSQIYSGALDGPGQGIEDKGVEYRDVMKSGLGR